MSHENTHSQPLFPLPGNSGVNRPLIPLDETKRLGELNPDDPVVVGRNPDNPLSRDMIVPAGNVVTHDGRPIWDAPDGASEHLDPNQTTVKLGGEVVAHTFFPDDPRRQR